MASGGFDENEHPFLSGDPAMGALIAAHDWAATALGPLAQWPAHLKAAVGTVLRSVVPMATLWGHEGLMIYNAAYARFSGDRHPQLLGQPVREAWPEAAAFNDQVMTTVMAGNTLSYRDFALVLNLRGVDEPAWMNLDYSPLADERGRTAGVLGVLVDVTAKVLMEQRMAIERERFSQLFDQSPSFMTLLDGPSHRIALANPGYQRLVGHRELLGRTVAEALPDAEAQGYVALLDQVYRSGQAFTANGSKYDVQATPGGPVTPRYVDFVFQPMRDVAGQVTGIFVEGIDVTERQQAERRREALASLTERFQRLDNDSDISFAAAEILGQTLEVSRVGYGTVNVEHDTLQIGRDWKSPGTHPLQDVLQLRNFGHFVDSLKRGELVNISDVREDPRTAKAAQALEDRRARSFLNVPVMEHGRLVALLYVNHSEVRHWKAEEIALVREVAARTRTAAERLRSESALRASEARLREANETLELKVAERTRALMEVEEKYRQAQKMEAIGQLTGGIAHDFNNLLGGMSTSLQVLEKRLNAQRFDNAERYIAMAQDSVKRAAALTQRLLAFSRRQTLDPKPTDVNRLVAGIEDLVRRTVGPNVEVEVVGAGGLWLTRIDASQLENALLNLCINARDAMSPQGGRLTLETANRWLDERTAVERDLAPGQYISVCVTDTGAGMTADVMARAFDPFFTTKPLGQGTGLGLSMVYGFVRQSGGQVRIYSEPGEGTTMCLYLPRHVGAADDEVTRPPAFTDTRGDGEVVLLVEDETTIRALIAEELQDAGYQVLEAADGPSGLRVLQGDSRIDLLLTDVGLPGGLNGRQVADAGRVTRPALKVLFITGYAENAAVGNGLLAHGMEVITKPFDVGALVAKVQQMVER